MNMSEGLPGNDSADSTQSLWGMGVRVSFSFTLAIIMALSVVGNMMVIVVITRHRGMRTRTNLFLCSLAIADLLCALLNMPVAIVTMSQGHWVWGEFMCHVNGFLVPFFFVASMHTLMYISIHKYVSIKKPFCHILTHRHILLLIIAAWVWAAVISYLTIHGLNEVNYKPATTQCAPKYPYNVVTYFHEGFSYGTCYVIPIMIMTFCYIKMFQEIRRHALRMEVGTSTERDVIFLQQRRITFTLFLVVVTFVVCWTPHFIYAAYVAFAKEKATVHPLANPIVYWFGYLNSVCNPIIYAIRSPAFREGYSQLLCRGKNTTANNDDYGDTYNRPFGRFRTFLKETLQGTLHASGSFTGTPVASPTGSRKSSMTSLTNYLLFPKSRTLSTSSLPGNFRFSVQPLILDHDTTKVSFIAGIPVLTKGGKIVSYQNPHEVPKRRNPMYYPSKIQTPLRPEKEASVSKVTEKSPLISHSHSDTKVPAKLSPHVEIPEIYINLNDNKVDVEEEYDDFGPEQQHLNPRNSCESGFNDVDHMSDEEADDQVFIVVADVEPIKPSEQETTETGTDQSLLVGGALLSPPTTVLTRQRVCKSVSDATDRQRPVTTVRTSVKKSTSDTCIKQTKDMSTSCTDLEAVKKKTVNQEKSIRKKILNRLFSKTKQNKSASSKSSSRSSQQDVHRHIDDDVSDSGMVSGFSGLHDSPSPGKLRDDTTHHSFSGYDAKCRKAHTLDNRQKGEHKALALSRSSSDPSLSQSSHSSKRHVKRAPRHRTGRSKRLHDRSKRRSRDFDQNGMNWLLSAASNKLQRSKSMKSGRYPSVEKLDRIRIGSDASALKKRITKKNNSSLPQGKDASLKTDMPCYIDVHQLKVFHMSGSKYLPSKRLHRSVSDPILTFKRIEEKVIQRTATKKWQRTKRGVRHRNNTDNADIDLAHSNKTQQHSSQHPSTSGILLIPRQPIAAHCVDESSPICQSNLSLDHLTPKRSQLSSTDPVSQSSLSLHRLSVDSCSAAYGPLHMQHSDICQSGLSLNNMPVTRVVLCKTSSQEVSGLYEDTVAGDLLGDQGTPGSRSQEKQ